MTGYLRVWRTMLALCLRERPRATAALLAATLVSTGGVAALGLTLKLLVDATQAGDRTTIVLAATGAALAFGAHWGLGLLVHLMTVKLVERVSLSRVEPEIMTICAGLPGIEHLERPEFLDRVTTLRGKSGALVDSVWAVLQAAASALGLAVTLAVLGSVNPWLLLLLACAAGQLWLERQGKRGVAAADLAAAPDLRLHRHLYHEVCTEPAAFAEVRTGGAAGDLLALQERAWHRAAAVRFRAALTAAAWSSAGWVLFAAGFAGAIALVASTGSPGQIVLAATVGAQLRGVVEAVLRRSAQAGGHRRVIAPYLWLRDYAATHRDGGGEAPPDRLRDGIELAGVTFTYPGAAAPAVRDVSATLPAGAVVALVGEYGSGKTTLVKLLAKLYRPGSGRITVDGADLERLDTAGWRAASSAAFQDFGRYQATFADAVTMGADHGDLAAAIAAAGADTLVDRLPQGTGTLLGARFGGVELSEGQWQKVALARACARPAPLLFVLDEPTASLDAPSEHAVFTGYIRRSRAIAAATGAITVIVSHRFSTVAEADLILVMAHGRLAEIGTHEELLAAGGGYATLYGVQATAYAAG
ncbi:ATP-binding cassette domain-containing protein [Sphaerisporangium sp. B11E5]|uniref:ATP-binding cassette domain-containing protein n=1 Tax=Sphaerisporangium sp. B11E5 TaxID=3153563 RepID=UPI00325EE60F